MEFQRLVSFIGITAVIGRENQSYNSKHAIYYKMHKQRKREPSLAPRLFAQKKTKCMELTRSDIITGSNNFAPGGLALLLTGSS